MRETIGLWAGYIENVAFVIFITAYTIEAAAKGWAISATILSPVMVFAWVLVIFWLAKTLGYIDA